MTGRPKLRYKKLTSTYCGFEEVRRNKSGEYFCSHCGKKLGADFRRILAAESPALVKKFDEQCKNGFNQHKEVIIMPHKSKKPYYPKSPGHPGKKKK